MFEALVGGFLLTGSVCILDGERDKACQEVRKIEFGNKYSCDQKVETILRRFPSIKPEQLGFAGAERLRVHVQCSPVLPHV